MASEIEVGNKRQQLATVLPLPQRATIELLLLGYSDSDIAREIGIRRETIWKWKHRDPKFQAALREGREVLAEAAAERLRGMLDRAATVVQRELQSSRADPKLAMALMKEMGVFERGSRAGQFERPQTIVSRASERTSDEDAEMEKLTNVIEGKLEKAMAISAGKRSG